jgi:hypothetical protein
MAFPVEPAIRVRGGIVSGRVSETILGSRGGIGPRGLSCPAVFVLFVAAVHGLERHAVLVDSLSSSFPFVSVVMLRTTFLESGQGLVWLCQSVRFVVREVFRWYDRTA